MKYILPCKQTGTTVFFRFLMWYTTTFLYWNIASGAMLLLESCLQTTRPLQSAPHMRGCSPLRTVEIFTLIINIQLKFCWRVDCRVRPIGQISHIIKIPLVMLWHICDWSVFPSCFTFEITTSWSQELNLCDITVGRSSWAKKVTKNRL